MTDPTYGYTKNLRSVSFDGVLQKVTDALKEQGFGVLTEIDVKATLKKKLDVDFRSYCILGACNPSLAHKALSSELAIGLLLPCNVIVLEEDDGTITVSIAKPREMFKMVSNASLAELAEEVDRKLQKVIDTI